jgi:GT2 family glycosyltransferase
VNGLQNQCWFLKSDDRRELVVRRTSAIGDSLAATCVASKLVEIGFQVRWQCHPDLHAMIRRVPVVATVEEPKANPHVNLDNAYEFHPHRKKVSFADIFVATACDQLTPRGVLIGGPTNCAPLLDVSAEEREKAISHIGEYPRPWVAFAARSNSHANRTIPDRTLADVARLTKGTCFWVANHTPATTGFIDLGLRSIDALIRAISVCDLFVGPDTGPMHIAAALKVPVIALEQASSPELHLSDQRDFQTIRRLDLACLNCQHNVCPLPGKQERPPCTEFDPALLANAINARLALQAKPDSVSCVIPTLKPPVDRLNRCIAAVLDQVDEVVVSKEAGGVFPFGATRHPKIRYVNAPKSDLGYGKNANFGVRHTNGNWLLLLNDDCFLEPGAIERLLEIGRRDERIAMVGHLLRYPDGRICSGGKVRTPGMRGWHLLDNRKHNPTVHEPRQMENITGTSVLVRRSAFYDVNGYDEDFTCYAEDDDFALRLRQAGHQIWYTPHASAIHMEAQTTAASGRIREMVSHGNTTFEKKWSWWWDQNINRVPIL